MNRRPLRLPHILAAALLALGTAAGATTIDLSAEASQAVANDQVVAIVYSEETGPAQEVARRVNERVSQALSLARRYPAVRAQTSATHTYPIYGKTRRVDAWRMRSDIKLESSDAGAIAELLGKLQQEMAVESVNAQPAETTRQNAEKALTVAAIAAFRAKAELVANALGSPYSIRQMTLGNSDGFAPVRPMMAVRAMAAEAAPMPMESGDSRLSVRVSGQIELLPAGR